MSMIPQKWRRLATGFALVAAVFIVFGFAAAVWGISGFLIILAATVLALTFLYYDWAQWAVAPRRTSFTLAKRHVAKLSHGRSRVRRRAANKLRGIGPDCAQLLPDLLTATQSHDPIVQSHVIQAIGRIGPDAKDAVPVLIDILRGDSGARVFAAMALGGIGPPAKESIPELCSALCEKNDVGLRIFAANALMQLGEHLDMALSVFKEMLKHEKPGIRRTVPCLLEKIGIHAKLAVPALLDALNDEDRKVRSLARRAIIKIDPVTAQSASIR